MDCTTCNRWSVYRKCVSVAEFVLLICMILYGPLLIWKLLCKYIDYVPFQPFCCHWKPVLRRLTQYVWVQYAGYWDRRVSNGLHCECWSNPFTPKRNKYRTYFIDASFVSRGRVLYSHQARIDWLHGTQNLKRLRHQKQGTAPTFIINDCTQTER